MRLSIYPRGSWDKIPTGYELTISPTRSRDQNLAVHSRLAPYLFYLYLQNAVTCCSYHHTHTHTHASSSSSREQLLTRAALSIISRVHIKPPIRR